MEPLSPRQQTPIHDDSEPSLETSSLIDVSFLLLIYFLITSTLDLVEGDLGLTFPPLTDGHSIGVVIDPITIELDSRGQVVMNGELLDRDPDSRNLPLLNDRLRTYVESAALTDSDPMIALDTSDESKAQRLVDVLNVLSDPGISISRVTFVQ